MRRNEVIDLQTYLPAQESDEDPGAGAPALPEGTSLLRSQYILKEFLAAGGFGITYLAQDSLLRDVVVKECFPSELCLRAGGSVRVRKAQHSEAYEAILESFVAEAHSLAALDHRNIVRVHQVFKENSTAYLAIDFVAGTDLFGLIEDPAKRPSPRLVRRITRKLLDAIEYIHARGMLHLDISPDNILIDGSDEPVLIDFGAARDRSTASKGTEWHSRFVKDGYSPPEFYDTDATRGASSDLYSLAASIHHLIVGEPPVAGDIRKDGVAAEGADPYVPLLGRVAGYDPHFLDALDQCLRLDPGDRIQSAEAWMQKIARRQRVDPQRMPPRAMPESAEAVDAAKLRRDMVNGGLVNGPKPSRVLPWAGIAAAVTLSLGVLGIYVLSSPSRIGNQNDVPRPAAMVGVAESSATPDPASSTPVGDARLSASLLVPSVLVTGLEAPATGADGYGSVLEPRAMSDPVWRVGISPAVPIGVGAGAWAPTQGAPARPVVFAAGAMVDPYPDEAFGYQIAHAGEPVSRQEIVQVARAAAPDPAPAFKAYPPAFPGLSVGPIVYAHWDVEMPFRAETGRVRKAHTARITEVSESADLDVAGSWIREGAVIYAFNGAPLTPDTALSAHVLNAMAVDPDGFTRSIVQYRDPELGTIDRGLLAVPVVRRIGLIDGTALEFRYREPSWQVSVREPGASDRNTLNSGDVVLGYSGDDAPIDAYEEFETVLSRADELGLESIELTVLRNGETVSARLPIEGDFE